MSKIGHGYGSEWHLLRYLGRHRHRLDEKVRGALEADAIRWNDFMFKQMSKWHDVEWTGVDFIGDEEVRSAWATFWPQSGSVQNWDAVGEVRRDGAWEWVLVEAKSYLSEPRTQCQAKERGGLDRIRGAFAEVKSALGVPEAADWLSGYYQYCNRIAALYFLDRIGVEANLLFVYFLGDQFPDEQKMCPKSESEWRDELEAQALHVALPPNHALAHRIYEIFLPVGG